MSPSRGALAFLSSVLCAATLAGGEGARIVFGERDGVQVKSPLSSEVRLARRLIPGRGPGGGAEGGLCSEAACTFQSLYRDPVEGNGVLLLFQETVLGKRVAAILLNGAEVCEAPPAPAGGLDGYNLCLVSRLPMNCAPQSESDPACPAEAACRVAERPVDAHIFGLRLEDGSTIEVCQEVIGGPPMANEAEFCVHPGEGPDLCASILADHGSCDVELENDDCDIIITGGNGGPPPSAIELRVEDDGVEVSERLERDADNVFCFRRSIPVKARGPHRVQVDLVVTREHARFLSWFNPQTGDSYNGLSGAYLSSWEDTATVECGGPPAPRDLSLRQVSFSAAGGNAVIASWAHPPGETYAQIHVYLDAPPGPPRLSLPGAERTARLDGLGPGLHRVGVEGDGGPQGGRSRIVEQAMDLLPASPHPSPIAGSVSCAFTPANGGTITASWTLAGPSSSIDVYLAGGAAPSFLRTIAGSSSTVSVTGVGPEASLALQFFKEVDGRHYGSPMLSCGGEPSARFIRGLCSGSGGPRPNITDAIFGLSHLFLGGEAPPCREACNTDGDGRLDITDMVALLSFLFLGGDAPAGWGDLNGDGPLDPTCKTAGEGADCRESHAACP